MAILFSAVPQCMFMAMETYEMFKDKHVQRKRAPGLMMVKCWKKHAPSFKKLRPGALFFQGLQKHDPGRFWAAATRVGVCNCGQASPPLQRLGSPASPQPPPLQPGILAAAFAVAVGRLCPEVGRLCPEVGKLCPEVGRPCPEVGRLCFEVKIKLKIS